MEKGNLSKRVKIISIQRPTSHPSRTLKFKQTGYIKHVR